MCSADFRQPKRCSWVVSSTGSAMHAVQEYLGSYVADEQGRLVFREGALVTAVRQGHWVVLDELNLAPSEVLEALNRHAVPSLGPAASLEVPLPTRCCHGSLWGRCTI